MLFPIAVHQTRVFCNLIVCTQAMSQFELRRKARSLAEAYTKLQATEAALRVSKDEAEKHAKAKSEFLAK